MTDLTAGVRAALADARLYLCTDARERQGDLPEFLDAVLAGGVDLVQLRQKNLEARQELAALEIFADACARHGRLFSVNDRADVAYSARADILHLGQDDLPVHDARWLLGGGVLIGRSTHDEDQVDSAIGRGGRRLLLRRADLADPDQARPARAGGRAAYATRRGARPGRGSRSVAST